MNTNISNSRESFEILNAGRYGNVYISLISQSGQWMNWNPFSVKIINTEDLTTTYIKHVNPHLTENQSNQ